MAANLDRAETSLTAVSDIAYIRGIDSSGNSVRISKADLASVLGATYIPYYKGSATLLGDFNEERIPGVYTCNPSVMQNKPSGMNDGQGFLIVIGGDYTNSYFIQILIPVSNTHAYIRVMYSGNWWKWSEL